MKKMDLEEYELIKLKNINNKIIGASLLFLGILPILGSLKEKKIESVPIALGGFILIYIGIYLLYKRVYLSGNQIKIVYFLRPTKIYDFSEIYIKCVHISSINFLSDGDNANYDGYEVYKGYKRLFTIEPFERNDSFINKMWQRGVKKR